MRPTGSEDGENILKEAADKCQWFKTCSEGAEWVLFSHQAEEESCSAAPVSRVEKKPLDCEFER